MNVYEAMRYAVQGLPNGGYHSGNPLNEAIPQVKEWLAAYDALAPDWSNAPDDAKWFTIDCDGDYCWHDVEPVLQINRWYSSNRYPSGTIDLPLGIDWRLCKWQRPEVK